MGSQSNMPDPVPNSRKGVWHEVVEDMQRRNEFGRKKYNVELQPFNFRDAKIDSYEELLDLIVYWKQTIIEEKEIKQLIIELDASDDPNKWAQILQWAKSGR